MARDALLPTFIVALHAAAVSVLADEDVQVDLGYRGSPTSGDYLWIGVDDPFAASLTAAGTASFAWSGSQRATGRGESGDVWCCVEAWNGEADSAAALARCYELWAPVASWLRATDAANVPGLLHAADDQHGIDLAWTGTDAVARLVVRVHYEGRI